MIRMSQIFLGLIVCAVLAGLQEAGSNPIEEVLYSGECVSECLRHIVPESSQGIRPGKALKLTPDQWHAPVYRLDCAGKPRRDFTLYNSLEFYFRSPNPDHGNPLFHLSTWNQRSRVLAIRDYISDGVIDNTFRLVRIPLADLVTENWDLGNVESLVWNSDSERRIYYVDNIVLRQTEPPELVAAGVHAPFPESNSVLKLTFNRRCKEKTVRKTTNYSISSPSDPAYASPLHPADVGIHWRVHGFSPSAVARVRFSAFIRLPIPLQTGTKYKLRVQGIADHFGNVMEPVEVVIHYDETNLLNPNIKVNQEGYLPDGPKVGYVGGYLGDLGGAVWAVGDKGTLIAWSDRASPRKHAPVVNTTLRSVSGIREDDLYCVGDMGVMLHWDGTKWKRIDLRTSQDLLAVHFSPDGVGWAVGANGVSFRCGEGEWIPVPTDSSTTLRGVWSGRQNTAWAVGDHGTILKWDGKKWLQEKPLTESDLYAVHGTHKDQLWAVGDNGKVLFYGPDGWSVFGSTQEKAATLRCVAGDPGGGVWIGGDDGLLWHKSGFGSSEFVVKPSGTVSSIYGLARQHARKLWAGGANGTLLSVLDTSPGWKNEALPFGETLRKVFAIPSGALRLPVPPPLATIQNAVSGKKILEVPLRLEAANWHLSGEDVYSFDFSSLKEPGIYRVSVSGLGLSDSFRIGEGVLDRVAYTVAHSLYYQRCGTALMEPYAEKRFARPLCHEHDPAGRKMDAAYHESLSVSPLSRGDNPGAMVDGQGGWHDAGDYGKYIPTAAAALWYLFTAYDIAPHKFPDGAWNIPESGNGVPDLLDEARWELDWIVKMQRSDGGVYHKLTSQRWFQGMPQQEATPRYFFESTTHDTASATAVLACAARLWRPYDSGLADHYLRRAVRGWNFLKQYPHPIPAGGFRNPPGNTTGEYRDSEDVDNRLWAAAELYRTTGEIQYKQYFESWWASNRKHPWGWNEWQQFYRCAYWAYLRSPWPDGDSDIKREIELTIKRNADEVVARTYDNPYRNGARLDVPEWIGWGVFTQSSKYAFVLLQAEALEKTAKYHAAALLNLDAQLGANPLSQCFVSGLGQRSPRDPLHLPSIHDEVKDPIPGLPIFGVAAHLPNKPPYYTAVQTDENSFPPSREPLDPYPILRRYVDAHELVPMSEFTIVDIAVCAATVHLLTPRPLGRVRE
jgi:hypothetical protein